MILRWQVGVDHEVERLLWRLVDIDAAAALIDVDDPAWDLLGKRDVALPPPTKLELPAKGVVPPPKAAMLAWKKADRNRKFTPG